MSLIVYLGVATTLVGLAGILWFMRRAKALKSSTADNATVQTELRKLVVINVAAVGVAFFGLALTVVGVILA
jgi:hypothetical protein